MNQLSSIQPFATSVEFYHLPAVRIIGREVRSGGQLGNTAPQLWGEMYASGAMDTLFSLPQIVDKCTFGWTSDYDPATDTFCYMVCVMTPADPPVPDGMTGRDIPATDCAVGLFGEDVMQTVARVESVGYAPNWELCPWNAEVNFAAEEENPPRQNCMPWRSLVPVNPL